MYLEIDNLEALCDGFDLAIFCSGKLFQINGQRKESEQPHPIGKVLFSS